jgi:formate-dependent nitrite reductase membrane component NrfD
VLHALWIPAIISSLLTTGYTGFLFAQGLARDLWQGPHATIDLVAQAIAEGAAVLMLAGLIPSTGGGVGLPWILAGALAVHLALIGFENVLMPSPTRHHKLANAAILRGAFSRLFWGGAVGSVAIAMVIAAMAGGDQSPLAPVLAAAALLALGGTFSWEYIWVEAGQSVPLS